MNRGRPIIQINFETFLQNEDSDSDTWSQVPFLCTDGPVTLQDTHSTRSELIKTSQGQRRRYATMTTGS
jgi:hypothetical protein